MNVAKFELIIGATNLTKTGKSITSSRLIFAAISSAISRRINYWRRIPRRFESPVVYTGDLKIALEIAAKIAAKFVAKIASVLNGPLEFRMLLMATARALTSWGIVLTRFQVPVTVMNGFLSSHFHLLQNLSIR